MPEIARGTSFCISSPFVDGVWRDEETGRGVAVWRNESRRRYPRRSRLYVIKQSIMVAWRRHSVYPESSRPCSSIVSGRDGQYGIDEDVVTAVGSLIGPSGQSVGRSGDDLEICRLGGVLK
jgi:hypothetical protein